MNHKDIMKRYFGGKSPWSGMNNQQRAGAAADLIGQAGNVAAMISAEHDEDIAKGLRTTGDALSVAGDAISSYDTDEEKDKKIPENLGLTPKSYKDFQGYRGGGIGSMSNNYINNHKKKNINYKEGFNLNVQ